MDRFTISVIDKKSSLKDVKSVEAIVQMLINNPFASFEKMDFDYKNKWDKSPNKDQAVRALRKNISRVAFGTRTPYFYKASFDKNQVQNVITLDMDRSYIGAFGFQDFRKYILELIGLFDESNYAAIKTIPEVSDYYLKHDIPSVASDCFRLYPNWIQFLIPDVYAKDFDKKDLLNCPAYKISEHQDGILELQMFEDPFGYNTPEVANRIRETNHYLEQCLKPIG